MNNTKRHDRHNSKPRLLCARHVGFCFGVQRAITVARQCACGQREKIRTLGPIIHNPQVVRELQNHGIRSVKTFSRMKKGETLIIRSHGIPLSVENKIRERGIHLVDASCPFVKKAQNLVSRLSRDGYETILIIGEKKHPEVEGLVSYGGPSRVYVVESLSDLKKLKLSGKVGVVCQTTQSPEVFHKFCSLLKKRKGLDLRIYDTICLETSRRQSDAIRLAKQADLILIVGGKNSANTTRLYHQCHAINRNSHHIEGAEELTRRMVKGAKTIGIISGASTPISTVQEIMERTGALCPEK